MNNGDNNNQNTTGQTQIQNSPVVSEPDVSTPQSVPTPVQETVTNISEPVVNQTIPETLELPPSPMKQMEIPTIAQPTEQVVIETVKKKTSNFGLVVLVLILILSVFFADEIISFFEKNIVSNNPTGNTKVESNNLTDGYILIDDSTSYIKIQQIKFYNYVKVDNAIIFSYYSDNKYDKSEPLKIYIELYNSEKELIYKELFSTSDSIEKEVVRTYTIELNNDILSQAFYALAKTYTEEEEAKKTTLVCKYKEIGEGYNLLYRNSYYFTNNVLTSYDVSKELDIIADSTVSNKYKNEILKEKNTIDVAKITNKYESNHLSYNVDLQEPIENFIPLYVKDTTMTIVKNKETLKKWECE